MFEYIKGEVTGKRIDYVTIDINGIGYKVNISLNTYNKIKNEKEKLYIYSYIREDAFVLYGFYDEEEREVFKILINSSGIGPKTAIAVLSTFTVIDLKDIILTDNFKTLTKVPGLGIKKAQKLILDIKDKIKTESIAGADNEREETGSYKIEEDLILALESLGYNEKDIEKFVTKEEIKKYKSIEEAIKDILKKIHSKK